MRRGYRPRVDDPAYVNSLRAYREGEALEALRVEESEAGVGALLVFDLNPNIVGK